jgi:hypothetical protein
MGGAKRYPSSLVGAEAMGFASLNPAYDVREKANFNPPFNMFAAFKPRRENNSIFQKQKSCVYSARPARQEGRYGQSSPDAARDAMDAIVRKDEARKRGRRNRAVPIPRRWNQVSCDEDARRRWLKSPVHRGDHV